MKRKFWNWVKNEDVGGRTLYLDGEISDETWYGDEVTPELFRRELVSGNGDITVWINSPGGDVFAAAQIYNMLMDYKGNVTVKVDALAASAASVIAMAGTMVQMSPVAMMMIHNPMTVAIGDSEEMKKAGAMLDEVKESIMNAYEIKTGLNRTKISHLMDSESWFNARKAVELGFADEISEDKSGNKEKENGLELEGMMFSRAAVANSLLDKLIPKNPEKKGIPAEQLEKRLNLGGKVIAFGDFKYYWIADRQGRSFKRLNELFAATGQVGFLGSQRVDGKLILPEAVKVLAMKAASGV